MTRVLCTRPNASEQINGVKFSLHKDKDGYPVGMISEPITQAEAEQFLEVPGYELVQEEKPAPAPAQADTPAPTPAPAPTPTPEPVAVPAPAPDVKPVSHDHPFEKGQGKVDKSDKAAAKAAAAAKTAAEKPPVETAPPVAPAADTKEPDPEETF